MKNILLGFLFAALWASASVVTKIGLRNDQPFLFFEVRFLIAGIIMLVYGHLILKEKLPAQNEILPLVIYGALNVSLYLGLYVTAMREVSAGLGSLAVAINPVLIAVISAIFQKKNILPYLWFALILGFLGVSVAIYPLLQSAHATVRGLLILFLSMLSYSVGTIYFSGRTWHQKLIVINGWQIIFGGLLLLPVTFAFTNLEKQVWDAQFWFCIFWLAIPISIGAVQIWLYLLRLDPVRASSWMYLNPIFGFFFAAIIINEPITIYTAVGTILVLISLWIVQKNKKQT